MAAVNRSRRLLGELVVLAVGVMVGVTTTGCFGSAATGDAAESQRSDPSAALRDYPLAGLPSAQISVKGHTFRVWLAQDYDPQRPGVVQEGLMHVSAEEIADDQGMLFVFADERYRSFWMRNTITPLDIAFARANGTIVQTWQMPPLTLSSFPSLEPAMFALEVKEGTFERLGIVAGDHMEIPDEVLTVQP